MGHGFHAFIIFHSYVQFPKGNVGLTAQMIFRDMEWCETGSIYHNIPGLSKTRFQPFFLCGSWFSWETGGRRASKLPTIGMSCDKNAGISHTYETTTVCIQTKFTKCSVNLWFKLGQTWVTFFWLWINTQPKTSLELIKPDYRPMAS